MEVKSLRFKVFYFGLIIVILNFALCTLNSREAGAQTFSLLPIVATKSAGVEFNVDLNIDTGGKQVTAADVKINFNATGLEVTEIEDGTFFPETSHNLYSGTLYVGGFFSGTPKSASGSGKLASLTLKGKTAGTAALTFVCSTQTSDSNIFDDSATPKDIINCAGVKNGSFTFTGTATGSAGLGGGAATETATPTPEPPTTGISWPTIFSFGFGASLFILGLALVF